MAKCSFGKVVLNGVFAPLYPFGTDLEGRFFYVEEGARRWLLATFDFSGTFRSTALAFRQAVSQATGIPVSHIWYHELQIHAAPISHELAGAPCQRLIALCLPEIQAMVARAQPAHIDYVLADFTGQFNLNREQYIPELGAVTAWAGLEIDSQGRPWTQNPAILNLDGYRPALPAFDTPIYFDRPADGQGLLAVLRAADGTVLGSLARFAAHPDVAVLFESHGIADQYRYHFDWTGYLRQAIDRQLGGIGLYLNGPCADLAVRKGYGGMTTYEACDREALRIGGLIAGALLRAWQARPPRWQALRLAGIAAATLPLPLRDTLPHSLQAAQHTGEGLQQAQRNLDAALAQSASPARIKRLIDEKLHQRTLRTMVQEWVGFTDAELSSRQAAVEAGAVCLNGLVFAGLPGECLAQTTTLLRAAALGQRLITLDQVNGYLGYVTTAQAYDQGGYSYWGGWVRRDAEALLRQQALGVIRSVSPDEG